MDQIINAALGSRWNLLAMGADLTTPDDSSGKNFSISSINNDTVEIKTSGGTKIKINRPAFVGVLRYLLENNHILQNPCSVGSNKDISKAGPLCRVARNANGVNIMIINYLLPLLAEMGLVAIDGTNPNSTWVL